LPPVALKSNNAGISWAPRSSRPLSTLSAGRLSCAPPRRARTYAQDVIERLVLPVLGSRQVEHCKACWRLSPRYSTADIQLARQPDDDFLLAIRRGMACTRLQADCPRSGALRWRVARGLQGVLRAAIWCRSVADWCACRYIGGMCGHVGSGSADGEVASYRG
jgi:hypothetical protein